MITLISSKKLGVRKKYEKHRTRAIITRGLDILNSLFDGQKRLSNGFSYVRLVFQSGL